MRFAHVNIIAKDWIKLSQFYQDVFQCEPYGPKRDLQGTWIEELTGLDKIHIKGRHLRLPGNGDCVVTLEIFSYNRINETKEKTINDWGLAHLAFEVEDVRATLEKLLSKGGEVIGEIVEKVYPEIGTATLVYCRDIEGNIIELQNWQK